MRPKVLLAEPIISDSERWGSFAREKGVNPPLGLLSIYAYLKSKNVDVTFWDSQLEENPQASFEKLLLKEKFDIIGISVFTNTALRSYLTAELGKKVLPDVLVVFGGVHVSSMPERTLNECSHVDILVTGEGEYTMEEIILNYQTGGRIRNPETIQGIAYRNSGGVRITSERKKIEDLDGLPSIYRHYDVDKYVPAPNQYRKLPSVPFMTQRGCPFPCSFCEVSVTLGKTVRFKSIEYILDELRYLKGRYHIKSVYFQDSTFTIKRKHTLALCEAMIKEDLGLEWSCSSRNDTVDLELLEAMKAAGCWQIVYGVESGNPKSLEVLKKGGRNTIDVVERTVAETKKVGIRVLTSFILAIPGEDEAMVWNTINFAKKLGPHTALFFLPVPYPGSDLYQECLRTGGIRQDATWNDYLSIDYDNPVYVNPLIGKEKMKALYHAAYRSFYWSPTVLWRNLSSIRSLEEIRRYIRATNALLGFFTKKKTHAFDEMFPLQKDA